MSKCKICNKKFKRNCDLSRHIKKIHKIDCETYYLKFLNNKKGKCKICGKPTKFINLSVGYNQTCGSKECLKEIDKKSVIKASLKKWGVKNPFQAKEVKEKIEQTNLKKFGTKRASQNEKVKNKISKSHKARTAEQKQKSLNLSKQTCLRLYGCENPGYFGQKASKEAIRNKYHVDNISQTNRWKKIIKDKKEEIINKQFETKRKNGTFSKSKPEEKFYAFLLKYFKKKDIIRQYKEERYPFHCDFYIKSLDLFIELNLYFTHGKHPFNKNNKDDKKILNNLKKLIKKEKHPQYETFIYVWTKLDPIKIKIAKENKLNYKTIYNQQELEILKNKLLKVKKHAK